MSKLTKPLAILLLIGISSLYFLWQQWPDNHFHYIACDVGQGDAHLLSVGFTQILIDTGNNNQVIECLSQFMPFWDRTIEIIIITHKDHDHIGGLESVLARYAVTHVFLNPSSKPLSPSLQRQLERSSVILETLTQGQRLSVEAGTQRLQYLTIWPPSCAIVFSSHDMSIWTPQNTSEADRTRRFVRQSATNCGSLEENDMSISGIVSYGQFSALFTGDMSVSVEQALISEALLRDVDVLKVAHHGSKDSTHQGLVAVARPETAVISVGQRNGYGHPHDIVLDRLNSSNIKVLLTSEFGNIHMVSDGNHYWMKKTRK